MVRLTNYGRLAWFATAILLIACSSSSPLSSSQPSPGATVPPSAQAAAGAPAFPYTTTGTDSKTLRLTKTPQRIVSLSPGTTETLFAIGAGDQIVAVDRFADYPEAAKARPKVDYSRPSIESLTAQQPDVIIASGRQRDTVPAMREAGLPVVMFDEAATLNDVLARIREIGRIAGRSTEAETLATDLDNRIRAIIGRLNGNQAGPRVYHEVSSQLHSATPSSFIGDFYTLLGARNIAQGATGAYPQLSQEVIIQRDPEVIVLADGREGVTVDQVRSRTGWNSISAVTTGRVYLLPDEQADMLSRPGPRVADGLEFLAKLLYPDRF